jgi:hypothetical protein
VKYEEFLEKWNSILLKVSWVIVPGALLLIAGHLIYAVARVMVRK